MLNIKNKLVVLAIATAFVTTTILSNTAFAADPKNGWGKATSGIATEDGRTFGEHASDPIPGNGDPHDTPRIGISNLANLLTDSHNPDELGNIVAGTLP
jgi:hypothetical protein